MDQEFKTPIYQLKAYRAYYQRVKDNEDFKQRRRESAKKHYYKKKAEAAAE